MEKAPARLEDSPVNVTAAPLSGAHNEDVYRDRLNCTPDSSRRLKNQEFV